MIVLIVKTRTFQPVMRKQNLCNLTNYKTANTQGQGEKWLKRVAGVKVALGHYTVTFKRKYMLFKLLYI